MSGEGMPQVRLGLNRVAIPPSLLDDRDETCSGQVFHDALHSPFRDSDGSGYLAHPDVRLLGQQHQYMCVIGEEGKLAMCCIQPV